MTPVGSSRSGSGGRLLLVRADIQQDTCSVCARVGVHLPYVWTLH